MKLPGLPLDLKGVVAVDAAASGSSVGFGF